MTAVPGAESVSLRPFDTKNHAKAVKPRPVVSRPPAYPAQPPSSQPARRQTSALFEVPNNKYSVNASAVGRPVEIHAYADRLIIRQDGRVVADHPRSFGRGEAIYDPWHYVPVLARKPGALRNGAPFKDWVLPTALEQVRRKLAGSNDGDRQMVAVLAAVLTDGLPAVEAACAQAMADGVHSSDVIINILARRRDPAPAVTVLTPEALALRHAPIAAGLLQMGPDTINSGAHDHGAH
jgi:hypothetical protein